MRAVCLSAGLFFVAILSTPGAGAGPHTTEPAVSVRYRGSPPGSPQLDELAAIRAIGFEAITWPERHAAAVAAVRKMADVVGLQVEVRPDAVPLSAAAARTPGAHVDVPAGRDFRMLTPLVWRAVAYGARSIAFDPGVTAGTGLARRDGTPEAWVAPGLAIARQLSANRRLVDVMRPGPPVTVATPVAPGLDVALLDGGRAWVIVATSLSPRAAQATVTFPKGVPYGLWASWLDDGGMSMLGLPAGPRWNLELEPYGTRVYFIDKN